MFYYLLIINFFTYLLKKRLKNTYLSFYVNLIAVLLCII